MPTLKDLKVGCLTKMKPVSETKVIVGLSGGVDSSVAALRLKQAGYQVEGVFMKNWEEDDTSSYCSHKTDLEDVRKVCNTLNIPLHTVNFAHEYWQRVFSHFLEEYKQGRTPNPDILCNQEIKFKEFLNHALKLGADFIATGHYAGVQVDPLHPGHYHLTESFDQNKDQTYFLYTLGQKQLSQTLFPLADLTKPTIRTIAKEAGLLTHNKKDSTGICFIGERPFNDFLKEYLVGKPGNIETPDGKVIGKHEGLIFFTLGQRKGLHIGGVKGAQESPWYVVAKNLNSQALIVTQEKNHPMGLSKSLVASQISWVDEPQTGRVQAKIRYRQAKQPCSVSFEENGLLQITFDTPQFAATPGQAVVLYQDNRCLGGGTIQSTDSEGGLLTF